MARLKASLTVESAGPGSLTGQTDASVPAAERTQADLDVEDILVPVSAMTSPSSGDRCIINLNGWFHKT